MAVLKIVTSPDPRRTPVDRRLRQKAQPVEVVDDAVRALLHDMRETMMTAHGVGLAGPQVGEMRRVAVVHIPADYDEEGDPEINLDLINPEIIRAGGQECALEGCLSFPDLVGEVPRYATVVVRARDAQGKEFRIKARGYLARALQHEIDHLDGVLFFDRMDDSSTLRYLEPVEAASEATAQSRAD
jgi:peptide deformylase